MRTSRLREQMLRIETGERKTMQIMEYIDQHREDENPCECVILPDGSVEDPTPSHIEKLTQLSGEERIALHEKMEKNMEPLFFMVEYTGCILVWQTRVVLPSHVSEAQEDTLERLYFATLLSPGYVRETVEQKYVDCVRQSK